MESGIKCSTTASLEVIDSVLLILVCFLCVVECFETSAPQLVVAYQSTRAVNVQPADAMHSESTLHTCKGIVKNRLVAKFS